MYSDKRRRTRTVLTRRDSGLGIFVRYYFCLHSARLQQQQPAQRNTSNNRNNSSNNMYVLATTSWACQHRGNDDALSVFSVVGFVIGMLVISSFGEYGETAPAAPTGCLPFSVVSFATTTPLPRPHQPTQQQHILTQLQQ